MLTIFATTKPFAGHVGLIQGNALRAWTSIRPRCEVVLFGDEPGTAEAAAEVGARHVPEVSRSAEGVPLLDDVFRRARELGRFDLLCYVNADILLTSAFVRVAAQARALAPRFLMVGRRTNLDVTEPIDVADPAWEAVLEEAARRLGVPTTPEWIDYFVFPRDLFDELLPLALGRAGFDNWLLWKAHASGATLVDASRSVVVVHQNHDYAHHPQGKQGVWEGRDATRNRLLIGDRRRYYYLTDADRLLVRGRLLPNPRQPWRRLGRYEPARRVRRAWYWLMGATLGARRRLGLQRRALARVRARLRRSA